MASMVVTGDRTSDNEIREQNVMAASSIANIVKSSLGPVGLDKMLVDDIGDVTITNDGATILKLLEVEHPAAKILCELKISIETLIQFPSKSSFIFQMIPEKIIGFEKN